MTETGVHPIYQRPHLHCGKCHSVLVSPKKKESHDADIKEGRHALMECIKCGVAVTVPAAMFGHSPHVHVGTTEARPWSQPKAVLTPEQLHAISLDKPVVTI